MAVIVTSVSIKTTGPEATFGSNDNRFKTIGNIDPKVVTTIIERKILPEMATIGQYPEYQEKYTVPTRKAQHNPNKKEVFHSVMTLFSILFQGIFP